MKRTPKCVFVPAEELCRKMIRALLKYGNKENEDRFLLRFGLTDS